ncbi:uncharacterized protein IWZ02DRAFT_80835 [Phyllosticta citriasiana]|uniref:uncharacterized protein n=1 Tax=Phyllosticta citriasiana TaxID=595635 RepID=UPI0030FD5BFB
MPQQHHHSVLACRQPLLHRNEPALVRMHSTTLPEVSVGTFVTARHAMFDGGPLTDRACGPRRPVFGRGAGLVSVSCLPSPAQPSPATKQVAAQPLCLCSFPTELDGTPAVHPFAQPAHSIRRQAPVLKTRKTTLLVFRLVKKQSPAMPPLPHFADHCSGSLPHVMSFVDSLTAKNSHHQTSPHRGPPGYTASFRHLRTTNRLFFANFFSRVFHKYSMELSSPTRGSSTNPFQFWQSRRSEAPARPNRQGGSTCPFSPLSSPFLSVIIGGPGAAKHAIRHRCHHTAS